MINIHRELYLNYKNSILPLTKKIQQLTTDEEYTPLETLHELLAQKIQLQHELQRRLDTEHNTP